MEGELLVGARDDEQKADDYRPTQQRSYMSKAKSLIWKWAWCASWERESLERLGAGELGSNAMKGGIGKPELDSQSLLGALRSLDLTLYVMGSYRTFLIRGWNDLIALKKNYWGRRTAVRVPGLRRLNSSDGIVFPSLSGFTFSASWTSSAHFWLHSSCWRAGLCHLCAPSTRSRPALGKHHWADGIEASTVPQGSQTSAYHTLLLWSGLEEWLFTGEFAFQRAFGNVWRYVWLS